jgi:hypothetical protein
MDDPPAKIVAGFGYEKDIQLKHERNAFAVSTLPDSQLKSRHPNWGTAFSTSGLCNFPYGKIFAES